MLARFGMFQIKAGPESRRIHRLVGGPENVQFGVVVDWFHWRSDPA